MSPNVRYALACRDLDHLALEIIALLIAEARFRRPLLTSK